jgi:hypothetical protein
MQRSWNMREHRDAVAALFSERRSGAGNPLDSLNMIFIIFSSARAQTAAA